MISLNIHDPWNIISDPHSRFTWEYDAVPFYSRNSTLFAILAILYLPMTFSLQHYMKNRTPFQLKTLLKVYFSFPYQFFSNYQLNIKKKPPKRYGTSPSLCFLS